MYRGTAHIILGSGLTIAGAVFCLHFTRLPYFQTLGVPAAIGVLVALVAALTLAPAVLSIGRHFGLFEPERPMRTRGWRRIGTAIVRWPGPILVVTIAIALIGLLALPGYKTSYDARPYMPANAPANVGYAAAERHFSQARLNPELLMIEADHDLRNSDRHARPGAGGQGRLPHRRVSPRCSPSPGRWARRSTTARSRFRSARKAPARSRT